VKPGEAPPPNQPVPRSDAQPPAEEPDNSGIPELKPNVAPDASAAGTSPATAPAPPAQINEAAGEQGQQTPSKADAGSSSAASAGDKSEEKVTSSSKKKKKKGLGKLNPF
jgi:outer membrane protein assembly factor BamD